MTCGHNYFDSIYLIQVQFAHFLGCTCTVTDKKVWGLQPIAHIRGIIVYGLVGSEIIGSAARDIVTCDRQSLSESMHSRSMEGLDGESESRLFFDPLLKLPAS